MGLFHTLAQPVRHNNSEEEKEMKRTAIIVVLSAAIAFGYTGTAYATTASVPSRGYECQPAVNNLGNPGWFGSNETQTVNGGDPVYFGVDPNSCTAISADNTVIVSLNGKTWRVYGGKAMTFPAVDGGMMEIRNVDHNCSTEVTVRFRHAPYQLHH